MTTINIHDGKSHLTKKLAKNGVLKVCFVEALMIRIAFVLWKGSVKKSATKVTAPILIASLFVAVNITIYPLDFT